MRGSPASTAAACPQQRSRAMPEADRIEERAHMRPPYSIPADDGDPPKEGDLIRSGSPLDRSKHTVASEEAVIEALKSIYDPEIPVNIYDLGLIYDLKIQDNGNADVI